MATDRRSERSLSPSFGKAVIPSPKSLISETRFKTLLVDLALCPDERASLLVVAFDEGVDVRLKLMDGLEGRTVQRLPAEDREPESRSD